MKRVWYIFLGLLENAKSYIHLLPSFIGLLLLLTFGAINDEFQNFFNNSNINKNTIGLIIASLGFLLWGGQGLIFIKREEFPLFFFTIKGKPAIVIGFLLFFICILVVIRGMSIAFR